MPFPLYVLNDDPENFTIHYYDQGRPKRRAALEGEWQAFNRMDPATRQVYRIRTRPTHHATGVAVDYRMPPGAAPGAYRLEVFVPGRHATTRKAIFSIAHHVHPGMRGETHLEESLAVVDMYDLYDIWHPLGEFYLDAGRHPEIGRVRQYDLSREDPPAEVSFGPLRWVPLAAHSSEGQIFDAPIGTQAERSAPFPSGRMLAGKLAHWVGNWYDANPFLSWYTYGYHTGADLNLAGGTEADKGQPVYAVGDGLVIFAGRAGSWGNIVVVEHPRALVTYPDGRVASQAVYSRYGHLADDLPVHKGEEVLRGQHLGAIGLAEGTTAGWHLHFDLSYTDVLKRRPAFWPDQRVIQAARRVGRDSHAFQSAQAANMRMVLEHFIDPMRFLQDNHHLDRV